MPLQRILETAVDDALRIDGLPVAQIPRFQQENLVASAMQFIQQPQAGDTATEDQDIDVQGTIIHDMSILRGECPTVKNGSDRDVEQAAG